VTLNKAARKTISITKKKQLSGVGLERFDEFVELFLDKNKNGRLNIRLDSLEKQVKIAQEAKILAPSSISINGSGGCIINSGSTNKKCTFSTNAVATVPKATKHGVDDHRDVDRKGKLKRKRERKNEDEKEEGEVEEGTAHDYLDRKRSKNSTQKRQVVVLDTNELMQSPDKIKMITARSTQNASSIKMIVLFTVIKELEHSSKSPIKKLKRMAVHGNKVVNFMGRNMLQNPDAISFQSIDEEKKATAANSSKGSGLSNDDRILSCTISERKNSSSSRVFLLTNDVNLQYKCFSAGIVPTTAEEFITDHMN